MENRNWEITLKLLLIISQNTFCFSMNTEAQIQALLGQGKKRLQEKKYQEAINLFKNAHDNGAERALPYLVIIHRNFSRFYFEGAIDCADCSISELGESHTELKNNYFQQVLDSTNIETILQMAELDPDNEKIIYTQWEKRLKSKAAHGNVNAKIALGIYYTFIEKDKKAEQCFLAIPNDAQAAHHLHMLYISQGKTSEAQEWEKEERRLGYDSGSSS